MNPFCQEENTWEMAGTPKSKEMKMEGEVRKGREIPSSLGQEFRMSEFVKEIAKTLERRDFKKQ